MVTKRVVLSLLSDLLNHRCVHWCICEEAADVGVCAPQVMADHLAAAKVLDSKSQLPVALVSFKQRRVCVRTKVLTE